MLIARVIGHVVATAKSQAYEGHKILRVMPEKLDGTLAEDQGPVIALDQVDAGTGDRVLICQEGRWARETVGDMNAPVRSMIVGIVDSINLAPEAPLPPTT